MTNGCIPGAPVGGHSSQAGVLLDGAAVALPDDPAELVCEDDLDLALPGALDWIAVVVLPADVDPVLEAPDVDPAAGGALAVVAEVG